MQLIFIEYSYYMYKSCKVEKAIIKTEKENEQTHTQT